MLYIVGGRRLGATSYVWELSSTMFGLGRREVVFMVHEYMFFSTFTHKNVLNWIAEEEKHSNGTFMVYFKCCRLYVQ